jgi:hypothetical protein
MVAMAFVGISLAGVVFCMMSLSNVAASEYRSRMARSQVLYVAEAGIAHALIDLRGGGEGNLGSPDAVVPFGPGVYYVTSVDNGDRTFSVTSRARVHGVRCTLRAELHSVQGVFYHAMFAGNSSGDPTYVLELGGTGTAADTVTGDIFSGNDIAVYGDATVSGQVRAAGIVTGVEGFEGVTQPNPDISMMDYATNHDVNVAAEFAANGAVQSSALGGTATEVPDTFPSHIFRLNPTDRQGVVDGTAKDDYFLEDPGHNPSPSPALNPASATQITLTPDGVNDGRTRQVFYIDGNLWIHNLRAMSFAINSGETGNVLLTFVVKGNIYFSDNVLLADEARDGLAFIAIKDENVEDSGNIIFGDATFGTLEKMEAYMFAENDFRDTNLPATGSEVVTVRGLMSAGNQIAIDREVDGRRTKLVLDHDDRIYTISLIEVGAQ